jgi:hypothetical protein
MLWPIWVICGLLPLVYEILILLHAAALSRDIQRNAVNPTKYETINHEVNKM